MGREELPGSITVRVADVSCGSWEARNDATSEASNFVHEVIEEHQEKDPECQGYCIQHQI
jgi:hypothetical protein